MSRKRRKISEIFKEVEKINNWRPSKKDLEELAEVLNEPSEENGEEAGGDLTLPSCH